MSAEVHDLRRARKRQPMPIPASACRIIGSMGINAPDTIGRVQYTLRTRKRGVEIMFKASASGAQAFTWNVSAMLDVWPENFAEARQWVAAYAAGYGQTVQEITKPRDPQPTGDDRKVFKAGGCREWWLRSDVPKLFGEATFRCQHAGGFCMQDGYCHFGTCDMEMESA
jgi:hypothetical protein